MRHQLKLFPDGTVDDFAAESEFEGVGHNGPLCTACGDAWCVWCVGVEYRAGRGPEKPWEEDDCDGGGDQTSTEARP